MIWVESKWSDSVPLTCSRVRWWSNRRRLTVRDCCRRLHKAARVFSKGKHSVSHQALRSKQRTWQRPVFSGPCSSGLLQVSKACISFKNSDNENKYVENSLPGPNKSCWAMTHVINKNRLDWTYRVMRSWAFSHCKSCGLFDKSLDNSKHRHMPTAFKIPSRRVTNWQEMI